MHLFQYSLEQLIYLVMGFLPVLYLATPIAEILRELPNSTIKPPNGVNKTQWKALLSTEESVNGSKLLGKYERILFYIVLHTRRYEILAGWMAFKLASKWEVWGNIIRVPETLGRAGSLDYLIARKRWGVRTYQRFTIGMLLDFFAANVGYFTFLFLDKWKPISFVLDNLEAWRL